MSWSKEGGGRRRGYHHGNLREALIEAALNLIAEKGAGGFSFADAARSAGVSPAAPYRHFRDRDALLADVAERAFQEFAERLEAAWDDGRPEPFAAFERTGQAYLAFAREEPAHYSAMFEAGIDRNATPELRRAADQAFGVLRRGAEALCALAPADSRPPAMMVALHVWSMAHGIASLFTRSEAAARSLPMAAEDLLEAGVLVYLQGLGLPVSSSKS